MEDIVRVLIVDDDALVRHALRAFLAADDRVVLIGEAVDGSEVVDLCQKLSPDVVLMDVRMSNVNGIEATRRVIDWNPRCRVVALTTLTTERCVLQILSAGACGYLLKSSTPEEIVSAVIAAHTGNPLAPPKFQNTRQESSGPTLAPRAKLSDRERHVVQLIAAGLSNAEIAVILRYAEGTVKADIRHINQLWRVTNRLQITLRATELGIIAI